ncbi:outer membrane protein [uncultured Devosia sp.]|uniref:outer membrane protein n=1 Tax=uncultured Devosia sp. TaxID=211434 RepID=UPI0035CA6FBD
MADAQRSVAALFWPCTEPISASNGSKLRFSSDCVPVIRQRWVSNVLEPRGKRDVAALIEMRGRMALIVFKKLLLSMLVGMLPVGGAMAADVITAPATTPAPLPVYQEPAFDWSGFYAGVYGAAQFGSTSDDQYGLGISAGVNAQFDFYLLGAEVAVHGLTGDVGETAYGQILGRAGLVVTDDVVVYGAGGYGLDLGAPDEDDILVGGGVELTVTDTISVEAQYLHGFPLSGDDDKDQFTIGANYHF